MKCRIGFRIFLGIFITWLTWPMFQIVSFLKYLVFFGGVFRFFQAVFLDNNCRIVFRIFFAKFYVKKEYLGLFETKKWHERKKSPISLQHSWRQKSLLPRSIAVLCCRALLPRLVPSLRCSTLLPWFVVALRCHAFPLNIVTRTRRTWGGSF